MLVFEAEAPPLGYNVYHIQAQDMIKKTDKRAEAATSRRRAGATMALENDNIKVNFCDNGRICSLENKKSGLKMTVDQNWLWYNASVGGTTIPGVTTSQKSGAYIFRPNTTTAYPVSSEPPTNTLVKGKVMQEVRSKWNDWVS